MFRKIGWSFPANDHGQENGLNDPGIETFKDRPLISLAREVLQNSLDAADEASQSPVTVHFELSTMPATEVPGMAEFKKTLEACRLYWTEPKTVEFFRRAGQVCDGLFLRVLKISDYNTTGLVLGKKGDKNSDWFRLTKSVGASSKHDGKLGSFGIGKHAPFACSDLRTVFYGTRDKNGRQAFQGVAKLVSHRREDKAIAQGTGYWGLKEGNEPKPDFSKLAEAFARGQTGADLYIAGFHEFENWEHDVVKSVLENFFMAVWRKNLQVRVGKTAVNSTSLPKLIAQYYAEPDPRFFADEYLKVLTSEEARTFEEPDFMGYGTVRLRLLEGKDFKNKVAMFRRSGMKIYDKGSFRTPVRFAGVLMAEGPKLDALLRSMEPPSHDDWLSERVDSDAERKVLKGLLQWVRDRVRELNTLDPATELDAVGMSEFLPDEQDEAAKGSQEASEEVQDEPAAELRMRLRPAPHPTAKAQEESGGSEEAGVGEEGGGGEQGSSGQGGDEGGEKDRAGAQSTSEPGRRVEFESVRGYCAKPGEGRYRFLLDPRRKRGGAPAGTHRGRSRLGARTRGALPD